MKFILRLLDRFLTAIGCPKDPWRREDRL